MEKTAVVTGASRGIGRSIALKLAELGYSVAVVYQGNTQRAEEVVLQCQEKGVKAIAIKADVSNSAECDSMIATAVAELGSVGVLVNNAGITRDTLAMKMTDDDFMSVIATNLAGPFYCSRAAIKHMLKQKYGRIINMSSIVALIGNVGQANYCASKAGLIGLTKAMAREYAKKGVTVNAIAPGFIETDMTAVLPDDVKQKLTEQVPMGKIGSPEDIANAVEYLVNSAYVTGQVISVNGGMAM